MSDKTEKEIRAQRRADAKLKRILYKRAAEMLRIGASYADKKEATWPRVYAEAGLTLILAAESL